MGVGANSSTNKSLNDRKERAAGRQKDRGPLREAIRDAGGAEHGRRAGGASGKNRRAGNVVGEGGGGGGATPSSKLAGVRASSKRTRKRG